MTSTEKLQRLAKLERRMLLIANSRGHVVRTSGPGAFIVVKPCQQRLYHCVKCGLEIEVNSAPAPNEIEIAGPAVALNCPKANQ